MALSDAWKFPKATAIGGSIHGPVNRDPENTAVQAYYDMMQERMKMESMQNALGAYNGYANQVGVVKDSPSGVLGATATRRRMLADRMRWTEGSIIPFEAIETFLCGDRETVIVFLIKDGKPVTLQDAANMYPSDALITQLRLLE